MDPKLSYMIWDVNREAFSLFGVSVYWYGILFALGFWCAYHFTVYAYKRILAARKGFYPHEIDYDWFKREFKTLKDVFDLSGLSADEVKRVEKGEWSRQLKAKVAILMSEQEAEDVDLELNRGEQKLMDAVANKQRFKWRLGVEKCFPKVFKSIQERAKRFVDRLTFFVVIGTVVGARLGHLMFYEEIGYYLTHPMMIFNTREGGLASHGAVIGIFLALWAFIRSYRRSGEVIAWRSIVDLLVIPACIAGVCIRLGNFVNQEIVGVPTGANWGVIFPRSFEGLSMVPRHPVQLYEALAYGLTGLFLWFFARARFNRLRLGEMSGVFFVILFSARFVVEFFKASQLPGSSLEAYLSIGQWLSLPMIAFGCVLFFASVASRRLWVDTEQVEVSVS